MQAGQQLFNGFDISWYTKNRMKSFLKKVGASFGFVIILMPIFGIILSIGNAANVSFLKEIGSILFSNIGIWFTLAIIIGFTSNKGAAVFTGVLSYLVVNVFIAASINKNNENTFFNIWFWHNLSVNAYLSKLFFGGIETFNSGVIGGILIGIYVTYIYNKFKDTQLPKGLEFFAREKLVIILSVIFSLIFASLFIIIWPVFGFILTAIGSGVAKSPIGLDSFIFRTVQRMLIPFGSSLLWQSPMWYTQIGGSLNEYQQDLLIQYLYRVTSQENLQTINLLASIPEKGHSQQEIIEIFSKYLNEYISYDWLFKSMNEWFENTNSIFATNPSGDQIIWNIVSTNKYITVDDCWNSGLRISRFISGGYVNSIFVLPTLSCLMFLMTPKGEKRAKVGIYITAALTAMLVGVTEPVEYLFCFTMPLFYFSIYCPFNGLIAAITSLFKVKVGTSFSTGLFDFTLSGIVPTVNGVNTRIWIIPLIGICSSITIFAIAFFWFKFFNKKENLININARKLRDSLQLFIEDLGGFKNIKQYSLKENQLEVVFKNVPDFKSLFNYVNKIEKQEKGLKLSIKPENEEVVLLFDKIYENRKTKKEINKSI
ncbi:PTS transporter subunit EIIC [Spiroplasma floricola]|uniref:PTS system, glucose-specific IIBC component n=1 Tax=Spiroplasma floricola 23-6 TaxID=1336749 RepID=A0A2K8SDM8_9MOLU|nr:PTS transporter subunit EIIC [Spiroplasma floricola]AUB31532.1 PTS system, glucose-specific IIBC component [Spiroplasma floricola 23-6]